MRLARDVFFAGYRNKFHGLSQEQVDGLNTLLDLIEDDTSWDEEVLQISIRQLSYFLATIKHECADRWHPIEEFASGAAYEGRKDLGNTETGDGKRFKGRGYVQITGRRNYGVFRDLLNEPLVTTPDLALQPTISYRIATLGMRLGLFTSHKLSQYFDDSKTDYVNARRIINGLDKANLIAGYAKNFESILRDATKNETPQDEAVLPETQEPKPVEADPEVHTENPTDKPVKDKPPDVHVQQGLPIVTSEVVTQASQGGFKSWISSVIAWATGAGAGLIALLKENPFLLYMAIGVIVLAVILVYIRQTILDSARMKAAADPTKFNVK